MTREQKLLTGLITISGLFLILIIALLYSLNWSALGISTMLFVLLYPLCWFCRRVWRFWCLPVMQLTTYSQMLKEGAYSQQLSLGGKDELFTELLAEIDGLSMEKTREKAQALSVEQLVSQMMESWSLPICLFDQDKRLLYSNGVANDLIKQPVLQGKLAEDIGFNWVNEGITHPAFLHGWEVNTIEYHQQGVTYWLFSAVNITDSLNQAEISSQKNIVRVLSHELRNSLTPMASMADTLLSSEQFSEPQVRMVLERILKRSTRLLNFIQQYARLNQLPKVKTSWFIFKTVLDEAMAMLPNTVEVNYVGETLCFADEGQLTQVLINLLKNAFEAYDEEKAEEKEQADSEEKGQAHTQTHSEGMAGQGLVIDVTLYHENNLQTLTIKDNGRGFANLANVLTPFYTTKPAGSGIGLALCAEIIRAHGGELIPQNREGMNGAVIHISLPL